jgi:hypothetical protein
VKSLLYSPSLGNTQNYRKDLLFFSGASSVLLQNVNDHLFHKVRTAQMPVASENKDAIMNESVHLKQQESAGASGKRQSFSSHICCERMSEAVYHRVW